MLSLKFVSSSLRGATSLATNQLSSTVSNNVSSSSSRLNSAYNQLHHHHHHHHHISQPIIHARTLSTTLVINQATSTRSLKNNVSFMEAELDLPPRPKKPITPWLAFVRERKDEVLRQKQNMTAAELSVILAKEWKMIDRSAYEVDYSRRREEYLKQVEEYENSLTDQQREYLRLRKSLNKESKVLRELRKTKPPTLPRNPANLYCIERCQEPQIKEQMKDGNASRVFSELFKEYRSMSDFEKQKYLDLQKKDKMRFQEHFKQWYEKIQADESVSKSVRQQADNMHDRFKTLNYI